MNNDSPTPRPDDPRRRRPPVDHAPSHPPLAAALLMIGLVLFLVVMSVVAVM